MRTLLIRGAARESKDKGGLRPVDYADQITSVGLKTELKAMLRKPSSWTCLMLKTPMKLMQKSFSTYFMLLALLLFNYLVLTFLVFPCKSQPSRISILHPTPTHPLTQCSHLCGLGHS